jgi:hypothetical protein
MSHGARPVAAGSPAASPAVPGRSTAGQPAAAGSTFYAGGGGLVVGRDRYQAPAVLRVFRPRLTRIVLIGALATAQLLTMRAMALGARVLVQSSRSASWAAFLQRCGAGPDTAVIGSFGSVPPIAATAERPQLLVVDAGAVDLQNIAFGGPWRTTLIFREDVAAWDIDTLSSVDLAVMQRLTEAEAALIAAALRLNQVQHWLPRIAPDMVALYEPGRLQWAMLSPTSVERQLFASIARSA